LPITGVLPPSASAANDYIAISNIFPVILSGASSAFSVVVAGTVGSIFVSASLLL